jgi:ribosome recycling factor
MAEPSLSEFERKMDSAIEVLRKEVGGLRTGRASASLVEPLQVEVYGSMMPLTQVGTVGVPEPRLITITVWDKGSVKAVEKAIRESNLGLNPQVDGNTVRVPIPELNQERRIELVKVASKYAEGARIAVRNVRRDAMDTLKKAEKDHEISEDRHKTMSDDVQKITDAHIKKIDELLIAKEKEIKQV